MKNLKEKPKSIGQFQSYLGDLYEEANKEREIEYLYSYLFRNASYLSRIIGEKKEPKINFIKTISWLMAISSKLKIDLEDAFVKKYPEVCPYCISKPCICVKTGKKPVEYIPEWKASEEIGIKYRIARSASPELSLDEAVEKVNDLYPANKHIWNAAGPTYQFYRILEELGEVHEAYTGFIRGQRTIENVQEELADVFAWIISSWGIVYPGLSLVDELIGYYYSGCPVCTTNRCSCPDHSDRGERLVEVNELIKFRRKLEEIISLAPDYKDSLDTIVESLNVVAETKSTVGAVRTVGQSKSILENISGNLKTVDSSAKSVGSMVKSALEIAKSFEWM